MNRQTAAQRRALARAAERRAAELERRIPLAPPGQKLQRLIELKIARTESLKHGRPAR